MCVAVKEISDLLNTGLDDETLKVCVQLLEAGVNAEALASVVLELKRETMVLKVQYYTPCSVRWVRIYFSRRKNKVH